MQSKSRGLWPALTLFFLAPAIGELLSGSAPPAEFFNPFMLFLLAALYGSGAILIRELRQRWDKGWPTVFALGAAYGILEEGLMVKSFFDPGWMDIGILGVYGRWGGVNWVWSLELTIYHAVFSIAIPILLVELLFPAQRQQTWLGRRGMIFLSLLLLGDVMLGFFLLTTYRPPMIPYLLAVITILLLYTLAKQLPSRVELKKESTGKAAPPTRNYALLGFGATLIFFFINWGWPNLGVPVFITLLADLCLVGAIVHIIYASAQRQGWDDKYRLALASGALGFFVLLAPLQELDTTRTDNTSGMSLVAMAFLLFLVYLWRRVKQNRDEPLRRTFDQEQASTKA